MFPFQSCWPVEDTWKIDSVSESQYVPSAGLRLMARRLSPVGSANWVTAAPLGETILMLGYAPRAVFPSGRRQAPVTLLWFATHPEQGAVRRIELGITLVELTRIGLAALGLGVVDDFNRARRIVARVADPGRPHDATGLGRGELVHVVDAVVGIVVGNELVADAAGRLGTRGPAAPRCRPCPSRPRRAARARPAPPAPGPAPPAPGPAPPAPTVDGSLPPPLVVPPPAPVSPPAPVVVPVAVVELPVVSPVVAGPLPSSPWCHPWSWWYCQLPGVTTRSRAGLFEFGPLAGAPVGEKENGSERPRGYATNWGDRTYFSWLPPI